MDTAMRDMDQLEERHYDDGPGRKVAMLAMAALSTVGLVFAMGVLLGRSGAPEEPEPSDPLAALDDAVAAGGVDEASVAREPESEDPEIDRTEMTFHDRLVGDERPEVAAAMAAAAAELEHLPPESMEEARIPRFDIGEVPTNVAPAQGEPDREPLQAPASPPSLGAPGAAPSPSVPEAQAPTPAGDLVRSPVATSAMEARSPRAESGSDGRYTLQVASYRDPEEAEVFAEALRARGHEAFVMEAEVPERGTFHRVRIGPFDSMREAESYRSDFEEEERMNTFVVRRRD